MRKALVGFAGVATIVLAAASASAQQTIKVGVILAYSGQFADPSAQMDNGIKLYMKQHGDTVAGKKIELIRKDTGGIAPDVAKRLAQELIVRDKVDMLAGFALTPNALAAGDVSAQAKKFMVIMNAATAIITTKSPYMVRTSFTVPQLNQTLGPGPTRAASARPTRWCPTSARATTARRRFQGLQGGRRRDHRLGALPGGQPGFLRLRAARQGRQPEAIYIWTPGGPQPAAIGKALAERGIDPRKTKVLGQGELTVGGRAEEHGRGRLGIITAFHYDYNHDSAMNKAFVKAYKEAFKRNPDMFSSAAYDGMHLIYEALKKTGGKTDGEA